MITKTTRTMAILLLTGVLGFLPAFLAEGTAGASGPPLKGVFADNFILLDQPVPAPKTALSLLDGGEVTLHDYRGKLLVVNFWATWCAPCIRELPSLERLQINNSAEGLEVLAISLDRGGAAQVGPFLADLGIGQMDILLDPKLKLAGELAVNGLPTTYLLDQQGRILGALEGPVEWDGADALELLRYYLSSELKIYRVGTGSSEE